MINSTSGTSIHYRLEKCGKRLREKGGGVHTGREERASQSSLPSRRGLVTTCVLVPTVVGGDTWVAWTLLGGSLAAGATSTAKCAWDHFAHNLVFPQDNQPQQPVFMHGVDITGHELLVNSEVQRAGEFAALWHGGQWRRTGEAYVVHCIETGRLVSCLVPPGAATSLRAQQAVIAAILHDVLDDTACTAQDLRTHFGSEVEALVLAVTRLSQVNQLLRRHRRALGLGAAEWSGEDAHTLRSVVLAIVDDPRVVLIKLADRLHNMRTLYALPQPKQMAFAQETLTLWCSVAARLGMFALKAELEDLCFAVLQPSSFQAIQASLVSLWGAGEKDSIISPDHQAAGEFALSSLSSSSSSSTVDSSGVTFQLLSSVIPFDYLTSRHGFSGYKDFSRLHPLSVAALGMLERCEMQLRLQMGVESCLSGITYTVQGRLKSLHSTQCKMTRKQVAVEGLFDARALRVVLNDQEGPEGHAQAVQGCYCILAVVHRLWRPIPEQFDDYICHPKQTGYQSLHTSVIGPNGSPLEIQIRTRSMHEMAEYGAAAHWVYKDISNGPTGVPPLAHPSQASCRPSSSPTFIPACPLSVTPGAAALRVDREGRREDAAIVEVEADGALLLAVSTRGRAGPKHIHPTFKEKYEGMVAEVHARGWREAGQGSDTLRMEEYILCQDRRYHLRDAYGVKHSECTLQVVEPRPAESELQHSSSSFSSVYSTSSNIDRSNAELKLDDKVRILRAMLEWEAELLGSTDSEPSPPSTTDSAPSTSLVSNSLSNSNDISLLSTTTTSSRLSALSTQSSTLSSDVCETNGNEAIPSSTPSTSSHSATLSNFDTSFPSIPTPIVTNSVSQPSLPNSPTSMPPRPRRRDEQYAVANCNILQSEITRLPTEEVIDVTVITWPDGKVHRLPSGSTVDDLYQKNVEVGDNLNVNNIRVPAGTLLKDGDLIIMQD